MLRKLRMKFVAIIMASVAVVLAVVFTGICVSEYQRSMNDVDIALTNAINRATEGMGDGRGFHAHDAGFGESGSPSSSSSGMAPSGVPADSSSAAPDGSLAPDGGTWLPDDANVQQDRRSGDFAGPRIGGEAGSERSIVPVAVYELTTATETSELSIVSGFTTAAIDDDVLAKASTRIPDVVDGSGALADLGLLYQKRTTETTTYVAFADTASASSWQSLAVTLVIAAMVVLAVFFVIALLISKWALRPVEEAWDSQRQFVADASHELKTPLTVVLANSSILLKHPEASIASQSQWIESTQIEAQNMQGLVNEMLELAQVESRANVQHEPVDLSDMVDGLVLQFESVAFERGCDLEGDIAEGISVSGDAQRLRKMMSTLIENALKYVDDRGAVHVRLGVEGRTARAVIRNTGSTIAPEDLPHIFDRFYRTDKARTSGEGGYGLGLAIAREIAREHQGDITCTSSAAEGTAFTVTLPVL